MLVTLKIENFRSVKEPLLISFATEKRLRDDDFHYNSFIINENELLHSLVIYGRNAAGKSNIIMAFKAISYLIEKSDTFKHDDELIPYEPFLFDNNCKNKPVKFEVDFLGIESKIKYKFILEFNKTKIIREALYFSPEGVISKLYDRNIDKITYGDYYKGSKKTVEYDLLKNQLFLSKSSRNKVKYLDEVYLFFKKYLYVSTFHDTEYDETIIRSLAKLSFENPVLKSNLLELLKAADTNIQDFEIIENEKSFNFPENFPENAKQGILDKFKYRIQTMHPLFENGTEIGKEILELEKESFGTKKFLSIGSLILDTLNEGGVIIIDELDKGLHPLLTKLLINLFHNKNNNPKHAQLIFATHDSALLDSNILRRDQICFVDKEYEGGTILYKLSDIKGVRKNIPLDKWYLSGRFRAIPVTSEIYLNF
jgi:AAA15 family ATPase/GTPase